MVAFLYLNMLAVMIISGQLAAQQLSFAPIFNDGAILQCELPVNIWGNASPGNTVDVFLNALNPQVILYIADNEYYT